MESSSMFESALPSVIEQTPRLHQQAQPADSYTLTWHEMKLHRLQRAEHKL